MPIQKERDRASSVKKFEVMDLLLEERYIAIANEAGIEANKKNLGPQNHPPYQLHHFE